MAEPADDVSTPGRLARRAIAGSFVSSGWTQLALVVSGVLTARMLGAEARGELALLVLLGAAFGLAGTLGLPLAVTYEIAQRGHDPRLVLRLVARNAAGQALLFSALHGLALAFLLPTADPEVRIAGIATLAWTPAFIALQYGLAALQGGLRLDAYNAFRAAPATLYAAATLALWVAGIHTLGAIGGVFALSWIAAALLVLGIAQGSQTSEASGNPPDLPSMRRFGLRSLVGWLVPIEAFRVDQAAVGLLVSPTALGLYVVAVAFTNLPRFIGQGIGSVAYPLVARHTDRDGARQEVGRVAAIASVVILALVLAAELAVGWLVPLLFGAGFEGAVPLARALLPAGGCLAIRRTLTDAARGAGFVSAGSVAEVVSWVVFGTGALLFVPRYQEMGVALAVLSASAASLAACTWVWLASTESPANAPSEVAPH